MNYLTKIRIDIPIFIICVMFVCSSIQCDFLNREQAIAKVGDAELTYNEVVNMVEQIGSEENFLNTQRRFVNDWVDQELLYQEALANNFEATPFMESELERIRKNMIINLFLKSQIDSLIYITENEIKDYYDNNRHEYSAETNYFKFFALQVSDRSFVQQIENELKNGTNISIIHTTAPDLCQIISSGSDYLSETILDPTIVGVLQKQNISSDFSRVTIGGDIFFVKVAEIVPKDETKPLEMVSQNIKQILLYNKYQEKHNNLLSRLRKNYAYEINISATADPDLRQKEE